MAADVALVDISHVLTDFTVEAPVVGVAEARVGADSVFAAAVICTGNGLACVPVWGGVEGWRGGYLIKYLCFQF